MSMFERVIATTRVGRAYWLARRRKFISREQLERWHDRKVCTHLRHVIAESAYYRNLFAGRDLGDWCSFPISDKHAMMSHFDQFNTIGVGKDEALAVARKAETTRDFRPTLRGATVGLSSGTSGSYSLFLASSRENSEFIGTALGRLLRGGLLARHRIAFFHRAHSNLYNSLDSGRMRHVFFDLRDDLESQFDHLQDLSPTLVIGPPFVLKRLGEAIRRRQLHIDPAGLLSVAEVLDDADRMSITANFGCPLDEAYIATEGFIAATCDHGSLHVNEDCLVMQREWLDESRRRFVPIITDFRRRVQPIIRYRLDDVLVDADSQNSQCPCGSVFAVLERVEGRCDDVLVAVTKDGQQPRRIFPDFIRRAVSFASSAVRDFRVSQGAVDRLHVQLDVCEADREPTERAVKDALVATFHDFDCTVPLIQFSLFAEADRSKKVRRVTRKFPSPMTELSVR